MDGIPCDALASSDVLFEPDDTGADRSPQIDFRDGRHGSRGTPLNGPARREVLGEQRRHPRS
jgi:hypothetical protein